MSDQQPPMENWKQFQGTELGGLMSKLYSNQSKPQINYPKPKTTKTFVPGKDFIALGSKADAADPRKSTRKSMEVAVPKNFKKSYHQFHQIDFIEKRRGADKIKEEIEDIKMKQQYYRPAHTRNSSCDHEKERLNQIFTYKGGKGLPTNLTHPEGETPMERAEKQKEVDRIYALRLKRGLITVEKPPARLSEKEELIEQIHREIDERTKYLEEMNELGVKSHNIHTIKAEISKKLQEIKRLEQE